MVWKRKVFRFEDIVQAKNDGVNITKTQTGEDAYKAIVEKFKDPAPGDMFYYKGNGVWRQKRDVSVKAPKCKNDSKKAGAPATPIPQKINKIPDVKPPESNALIPELKGGFNRGIRPKNKIEIYSIEDVMRCTDKNIVGFLPIYKNGITLS